MPSTKTKTTPPGKKRIGVRSLKSAADVRRLLGKLMRLHLAGELDSNALKAQGYVATVLLKAMEHETLETEITEIRQMIEDQEL